MRNSDEDWREEFVEGYRAPIPGEEESLQWLEETWDEQYSRDQGVFTDDDRRLLWGLITPEDYAQRSTYSGRLSDIRKRLREAILDGGYLNFVPDEQREKALAEIEDEYELESALISWLEFIYKATGRNIEFFEGLIASAVRGSEEISYEERRDALPHEYLVESVDVDIDVVRSPGPDEVEEKLRSQGGDALSPEEIGILVRSGRVSPDELDDLRGPPWPEGDED